jgi:hypothetical protein
LHHYTFFYGTVFVPIEKIHNMKKLISITCLVFLIVLVQAQGNKSDVLKSLEASNQGKQDQNVTATLKSASRLFSAKEDITSVIVIIPSGTVVNVLGSDSTYLNVSFEDNQGFIYKRDAIINSAPAEVNSPVKQENVMRKDQQVEEKQVSRFTYLENKYGTDMAARLAAGKIWKGMSGEMVRDSWGSPLKINRLIGNNVKEEWIYKNTWLYIENNTLVDWGPVKQ